MTGEKFTIVKGYKTFQGDAVGEPMDEPTEEHLFAWLRNRGYTDKQASQIIQQVDQNGLQVITLP